MGLITTTVYYFANKQKLPLVTRSKSAGTIMKGFYQHPEIIRYNVGWSLAHVMNRQEINNNVDVLLQFAL